MAWDIHIPSVENLVDIALNGENSHVIITVNEYGGTSYVPVPFNTTVDQQKKTVRDGVFISVIDLNEETEPQIEETCKALDKRTNKKTKRW